MDTISVVPGTRIGSAAGIAAVSASIYDLANSNSPTSYDPYALAGAIYAGVATFLGPIGSIMSFFDILRIVSICNSLE